MKKLLLASLLLASCGTSEPSETKIVGGKQVYRTWYGSIENRGNHRCGSTLIGNGRWALTAKHCNTKVGFKVKFGSYDRDSKTNGDKAFDLVPIIKVIDHPTLDLALLKLGRYSKFKPVKPANRSFPHDYKLHAFGMGNNGWKMPNQPDILRGVVLRNRIRNNGNPDIQYTDGSNGRGVCHGDSGGPLLDPQKRELIGVARFTGSKCASTRGQDGFTKPDIDWIRKFVK